MELKKIGHCNIYTDNFAMLGWPDIYIYIYIREVCITNNNFRFCYGRLLIHKPNIKQRNIMKRNDYYIELNLFSQKYLLPNELINYHRVRGTFSRLRIYAGLQIRAQHWGGDDQHILVTFLILWGG